MANASFSFPEPGTIGIPFMAKCMPPNISQAESTCLINRVIKLGAGYPTRCIFVKKQQIVSGDDGRSCHYSGTFRPFVLPVVSGRPDRRTSKNKGGDRGNVLPEERTHGQREDTSTSDASSHASADTQRTISTAEADHCPIDEERGDGLMFWFSDDDSPDIKRRRGRRADTTSVPITSRARVLSTQHDTTRAQLGT